jgi:hypothetical protein
MLRSLAASLIILLGPAVAFAQEHSTPNDHTNPTSNAFNKVNSGANVES